MTITPETAASYILVFARVGALVMLLPGLGERMISARSRLALAVLLTLVFHPLASRSLPALAGGIAAPATIAVLIGEIAVGLMLGLAARMVVASLQTAGTIVAQQLGLAFAQQVNPAAGSYDAVLTNFLTLLGITLIFATDLHHVAIAGIQGSYAILPPGGVPASGDAAMLAIKAVGRGFTVAVQIAAPFIVFGLLFNLGLGVLSRLMPQMQVFFLAMPATIIAGMVILLAVLGIMMGVFLEDVRAFLGEMLPG
ncbi:flagellar biosynthetic protein FliR [Chelatococcus sp. SYSU_G07232]|uniref:Flagellar biosynthetic protein FliR n=1 Tax=Chelatococcus albus TaxID=3047466 RepID=A0ABT7AGH9_9HYPH|nr:flagellar biosynthetic protein FliR [Chelatococcus sp. SYSU_G07232]MDJ1158438.1 flagellar biosynthetic protein FliR [Chelatococcus sp. SYSU_G07232]